MSIDIERAPEKSRQAIPCRPSTGAWCTTHPTPPLKAAEHPVATIELLLFDARIDVDELLRQAPCVSRRAHAALAQERNGLGRQDGQSGQRDDGGTSCTM